MTNRAVDQSPGRPRRRRRRWVALGILGVAIIGGFLSWRYRVDLADQTARAVMQALDLDGEISFRVAEVEPTRIRLEKLSFGKDGPTAAAAEIMFRPSDVLKGRIQTIRLIQPSLAIGQSNTGDIAIDGIDLTAKEAEAEIARDFPELPDVGALEIIDAEIMLNIDGFDGVALGDGQIRRQADGSHAARLSLHAATSDGRQASLTVENAALAYSPTRIAITGPIEVAASDSSADAALGVKLHLSLEAAAAGDIQAAVILMGGSAEIGADIGFDGLAGRLETRMTPDKAPMVSGQFNVRNVRAPSTQFDLAAVDFSGSENGARVSVDGVGPTGHLDLDLDGGGEAGLVGFSARGQVDATSLAAFVSDAEAAGRLRIEAGGAVNLQAMMQSPGIEHINGAAKLTLEIPKVSIKGVAPKGAIQGNADLELAGGALTFTGRGISLSGINLPDAILKALPASIRNALEEPAFVRLGGPGIADTVITLSRGLGQGVAAVGRIGLGVSNPNVALFMEGDAALALNADWEVDFLESERLVVRLVDTSLGDAHVAGRVELFGLSGAGETFSADATLEAFARYDGDGIAVEDAEFDLTGPLLIEPGRAVLTPQPGGKIVIKGYTGPQLSAAGPIDLTLISASNRVAYDRTTDELAASLDFRGFRTKGALNADELGTGEVDLKLGGLGVTLTPKGAAIRLNEVAAKFPAYDLVLGGGDARIAFGGDAAQSGRLTIGRIYHDIAAPVFAPLRLRVDVEGRGDRLTFEGALLAADQQARMDVTGVHDLATGIGEAKVVMPPIVFAPGVLQPQDFIPALYRTILEAVGEIAAEADLAWNVDGLTREEARIDITVDKLRSSELSIERMSSAFRLDRLFPPSSDGPQRVQVGELNIGVPLVSGAFEIDVISPDQVDLSLEEFGLFGGVISSREATVNPTQESFQLNLEVTDIDLASILAFAEFGELQATGKLEGVLPLQYDKGELRIDGGLLKTAAGGGVIRYKPAEIDEALSKVDRSSELALKAISNFEYDSFRIGINENDSEEIRLDIFMAGLSRDLFEGVPFEFNIVIEGPLRQIIQDNVSPVDLPDDVQQLIDEAEGIQFDPPPAPAAGRDFVLEWEEGPDA